MSERAPLASIALISCAALANEILLTRFFAIVHWYHFAYMMISLALLGFGASGTFLFIARGLAVAAIRAGVQREPAAVRLLRAARPVDRAGAAVQSRGAAVGSLAAAVARRDLSHALDRLFLCRQRDRADADGLSPLDRAESTRRTWRALASGAC